jgi:serine/threonine-protein kinase
MSVYQDDIEKCRLDGIGLNQIENDPAIGKVIADRYEIASVLAKGGMGVVYKAKHCYMDRDIAVKMLPEHLTGDPEIIARFKQEAQLISKVKNSHTVTLYDFGVTETGQAYLVMDLIDGISLRALLKKEGPLPIGRAQHIFQQALTALQAAHENKVVHKDIKPENIMLTHKFDEDDWVQLVDFGIASFSENNKFDYADLLKAGVIGSPPYMSPEQCQKSTKIDERSDLYSLAIVIFEALTGKLPYEAKSSQQMIESHLAGEPALLQDKRADLNVCIELTQVLRKAMEKNPDNRHQSASEFAQDLNRAIKSDSTKLMSLKHRTEFFQKNSHEPLSDTSSDKKGSLFGIFIQTLKNLFAKDKDLDSQKRFQFYQCPHCSEILTPDIAFCLSCGRALPSSREYSKLRSAQRIFSYPKKSQEAANQILPQIGKRIRRAEMNVLKKRIIFFAFTFTIICLVIKLWGWPYIKQIVAYALNR